MLTRRAFLLGLTLNAGNPSAVTVDEIGDQVQTVPRGQLPTFAGPAPHIRLAYRYAMERGEDLAAVPCYCGCVRFGHRGNRDCYDFLWPLTPRWRPRAASGSISRRFCAIGHGRS